MDQDLKAALKRAILQSAPHLQAALGRQIEPHLIWTKEGEGSWLGQVEHRPSMGDAFVQAHGAIETNATEFVEIFLRQPEYATSLGSVRFGWFNFAQHPTQIVRSALGRLWESHGTFQPHERVADEVVDEIEAFFDLPTFPVHFQALLLNFTMELDRLDLPLGLAIRRLTPAEVTSYYGGNLYSLGVYRQRMVGINEFVIEGEIEDRKSGTDQEPPIEPDPVAKLLDSAVLALRTLKAGAVGYDRIYFQAVNPCLIGPIYCMPGGLHIPMGRYELLPTETKAFQEWVALVISVSEAAMETACSRLSDAELRVNPRDRAVDAVIGLEAILLAGLSREDRRGELSYRFSMRYSALFNTPKERLAAYGLARDLYSLRSSIAHGSEMDGLHRIGTERLALDEAARRANQTLREVIRRFLPEARSAPYTRADFWDRLIFGLPQTD